MPTQPTIIRDDTSSPVSPTSPIRVRRTSLEVLESMEANGRARRAREASIIQEAEAEAHRTTRAEAAASNIAQGESDALAALRAQLDSDPDSDPIKEGPAIPNTTAAVTPRPRPISVAKARNHLGLEVEVHAVQVSAPSRPSPSAPTIPTVIPRPIPKTTIPPLQPGQIRTSSIPAPTPLTDVVPRPKSHTIAPWNSPVSSPSTRVPLESAEERWIREKKQDEAAERAGALRMEAMVYKVGVERGATIEDIDGMVLEDPEAFELTELDERGRGKELKEDGGEGVGLGGRFCCGGGGCVVM